MTAAAIERRVAAEYRVAGRRLEGYAAIFGADARIADFTEVIRPGAFTATLATGHDIVGLVDHDPTRLLARTASGTLELRQDQKGLGFALQVPETRDGRDVLALAERGDLGGMSFGFRVPPGGERWRGRTRELLTIDLREISVVAAWPAYAGTEVVARARPPARLAMARRYLETL